MSKYHIGHRELLVDIYKYTNTLFPIPDNAAQQTVSELEEWGYIKTTAGYCGDISKGYTYLTEKGWEEGKTWSEEAQRKAKEAERVASVISDEGKTQRSMTPRGFARAFFAANP